MTVDARAASDILAGFQAIAAVTGRTLPASELAEVCERFYETFREVATIKMWDENRRDHVAYETWTWKASNPVGWLIKCSRNFDESQARLLAYLDNYEGKLRNQIREQLRYRRKHPRDPAVTALLDELRARAPAIYAALEAEPDDEPGQGGTRREVGQPVVRERTFSDFVDPSERAP